MNIIERIRKYYMKYQWHRYKKAYRARQLKVAYAPREIWIEPTNRCNLRCVMCPQSQGITAPMGMMDLELYKKILDEMKAIRSQRINLFLGGESLLHKDIVKMAILARERGIPVRLHTNATLLTEVIAKGLLDSKALEEISFSFDAEDPEYYEKLRKNARYEKTKANIIRFLELKRDTGLKPPKVTMQVIKERKPDGTPEEISEEFKAMFDGLPLDRFRKVCFHNFGGTLDAGDMVKYELAKANYKPCIHPWKSFNICWDGTVVACCLDLNRKLVLGDVREKSIMEIWNDEPIVSLRRSMVEKKFEDMEACRECDNFWS